MASSSSTTADPPAAARDQPDNKFLPGQLGFYLSQRPDIALQRRRLGGFLTGEGAAAVETTVEMDGAVFEEVWPYMSNIWVVDRKNRFRVVTATAGNPQGSRVYMCKLDRVGARSVGGSGSIRGYHPCRAIMRATTTYQVVDGALTDTVISATFDFQTDPPYDGGHFHAHDIGACDDKWINKGVRGAAQRMMTDYWLDSSWECHNRWFEDPASQAIGFRCGVGPTVGMTSDTWRKMRNTVRANLGLVGVPQTRQAGNGGEARVAALAQMRAQRTALLTATGGGAEGLDGAAAAAAAAGGHLAVSRKRRGRPPRPREGSAEWLQGRGMPRPNRHNQAVEEAFVRGGLFAVQNPGVPVPEPPRFYGPHLQPPRTMRGFNGSSLHNFSFSQRGHHQGADAETEIDEDDGVSNASDSDDDPDAEKQHQPPGLDNTTVAERRPKRQKKEESFQDKLKRRNLRRLRELWGGDSFVPEGASRRPEDMGFSALRLMRQMSEMALHFAVPLASLWEEGGACHEACVVFGKRSTVHGGVELYLSEYTALMAARRLRRHLGVPDPPPRNTWGPVGKKRSRRAAAFDGGGAAHGFTPERGAFGPDATGGGMANGFEDRLDEYTDDDEAVDQDSFLVKREPQSPLSMGFGVPDVSQWPGDAYRLSSVASGPSIQDVNSNPLKRSADQMSADHGGFHHPPRHDRPADSRDIPPLPLPRGELQATAATPQQQPPSVRRAAFPTANRLARAKAELARAEADVAAATDWLRPVYRLLSRPLARIVITTGAADDHDLDPASLLDPGKEEERAARTAEIRDIAVDIDDSMALSALGLCEAIKKELAAFAKVRERSQKALDEEVMRVLHEAEQPIW